MGGWSGVVGAETAETETGRFLRGGCVLGWRDCTVHNEMARMSGMAYTGAAEAMTGPMQAGLARLQQDVKVGDELGTLHKSRQLCSELTRQQQDGTMRWQGEVVEMASG
eukprot:scaffold235946_cov15-Tisochrysis_lutea.AAC.1